MIHSKSAKNALWIIGCRIIQSGVALAVTMLSARYLGPSDFGLINYAASLVAFFVPIMRLGLNATLVRELLLDPEHEGEIMGTTLAMTFLSAIASVIGVGIVSSLLNSGEPHTVIVCILYSILLITQSMEMIQYWYQSKLLSKYTSITILGAYIIVALYRIWILITDRSIYLFAISQAIDFAIIAVVLLILYFKLMGRPLKVSARRAAAMLSRSKYYIISGIMITLFAQTDRIMLNLWLDEAAVGFYSAAASCATLTSFVFVAIIDSARPAIIEANKESQEAFEKRTKMLFSAVVILAMLQSVAITIFARTVIRILYGTDYDPSIAALRIIVWFTTFSYLGAARDVWILAEGKQKYLLTINFAGALTNILLNAVLIPVYGIYGAAFASLVTQFFTNVVTGWIIPAIRPCNRLMLQALHPREIHGMIKQYIKGQA